jgi:hypothetical protein
MTHFLGCDGGEVRVTRGLTHDLAHCASCGSESWSCSRELGHSGPCAASPLPKTRFYGGTGTIHSTGHVDVETRNGNVVAVWFRCSMLPFEQTKVGLDRAEEMLSTAEHESPLAINGIEFEIPRADGPTW